MSQEPGDGLCDLGYSTYDDDSALRGRLEEQIQRRVEENKQWEQMLETYSSMRTKSQKKRDAVLSSPEEGRFAMHGSRTSSFVTPPKFDLNIAGILNDVQNSVQMCDLLVRALRREKGKQRLATGATSVQRKGRLCPNQSLLEWITDNESAMQCSVRLTDLSMSIGDLPHNKTARHLVNNLVD